MPYENKKRETANVLKLLTELHEPHFLIEIYKHTHTF